MEVTYSVYLDTTGRSVADFLATTPVYSGATTGGWVKRVVDLSSYAGKNVNIAFRHFDNPGNGYAIILDSIQIIETVGIDNVENNTVNIYPTPTNNTLNIEGNGIRNIQMFDAFGRMVLESATGGRYDIINFANGVYIVRVTTDNGISTKKVVKK